MSTPHSHRHDAQSIYARAGRHALGALAVGVLAAAALLCTANVDAAGRSVAFRAADGRTIDGLLFEANVRPAAAVVMLPMLGRPKDDFANAGQRLADAGITALAIDLPGTVVPGDGDALARWSQDALAAFEFLASRPADVRSSSVGLLGASLGANLAVVAAAAAPAVRSIALISPSLDYRGLRIEGSLREYGGRPALLMASLRDPYAARSVRELAQDAPGPRQMRWSETAGHGTVLLVRDPDLVRSLIEWFQLTLG